MNPEQMISQLAGFYNHDQFSEIYLLHADEFKQHVSEKTVMDFYKYDIKRSLGEITSWEFIKTEEEVSEYLINFKYGELSLKITLKADHLLALVNWEPVHQEEEILNSKDPLTILSNNLLETPLQRFIDQLAIKYLQDPNNRSLSIGLVHGTHIEKFFYGETQQGNSTLPGSHSLYEIGSISKTFTAVILAHAINQGRIKLNDDIRKFLSADYPNLQFEGTPIRIIDLCNHTSGLPGLPENFEEHKGYEENNPYLNYSKEMIVEYLGNFILDEPPGTRAEYSNLGFAILGMILEDIYQLPLKKLLQDVITVPLGMKNTTYEVPASHQNSLVAGYDHESGEDAGYWNLGAFKAAGGLKSDLDDLLIYLRANINDYTRDFSLPHHQTDIQPGYGRGLAWVTQFFNDDTIIWHNGGTGGFRSYCAFVKEKQTGLVVLSNSSKDVDDMALEILLYSIQDL